MVKFLLAIVLAAMGLTAPAATEPAHVGVILMHGKWGNPPGPLAGVFKDRGYMVVSPYMPWGRTGNYSKSYVAALEQIHQTVLELRAKGARVVILGGESFGANGTLAYATLYDDVDALLLFAPGHSPQTWYRRGVTKNAVDQAREMVQQGRGDERFSFVDLNQGKSDGKSATAAIYLSYFDPDGLGNMFKSAKFVKRGLPVLCVASDAEKDFARTQIFDALPPNPLSVFLQVDAGHTDASTRAQGEAIQFVESVLKQ